MKFTENLISGTLIKRYKRFIVDVKVNSQIITAHCPNSGSMLGLLDENNKIWISQSNNPKRKLKYTLELIKIKNSLVGINTIFANKIILEALTNKTIKEFSKFENIKIEAVYNDDTRFDFLLNNNSRKVFLEVKNVTLSTKKGVAEFPDSITLRGTKHLIKLIEAKKESYESYILYLIQREDCNQFKIADKIDIEYKKAFIEAKKKGVKILCYNCKLSPQEIKINKLVKIL
ncbi:MAG: DNA/RNA nuclease SfsA [Pelagibacteraceae bacterium]|nr:DNA/RNA nuclease SfsA [Pelagibacteraceae bacterium]